MDHLLSVIMSVYNTKELYLREAIESILNQSFKEYQFIIINDGSNDRTTDILKEYQHLDKRVQIINNKKNYGLTISLNIGLVNAKGKYIARMDSDDVSYVDRFEMQYQFMETHPEIDVLGTWVKRGNKTSKSNWRADREWRKVSMLFGNAGIYHPTAFIRKSFLDKHGIKYDEKMKKAQDYDLWCQCLDCGTIAVLPKELLMYRVSREQITVRNSNEQNYYRNIIRKKELDKIYDGYSERELSQFLNMDKDILSAEELEKFWNKILENNDKRKVLNAEILKLKFFEERTRIIMGKYYRQKRIKYISIKWLCMMLSPRIWLYLINDWLIIKK